MEYYWNETFTYFYDATPMIREIFPTFGSRKGNTIITVQGFNFTDVSDKISFVFTRKLQALNYII